MLRVGDYVTGKSVMGTPVTGKIVYAGAEGLVVDDGNRPYYCSPEDVAKMDPPIPNEDVMLDEFDEGGLKKMPDGTLESVHIPEEDDDSYKTVPLKKTGEVYLISKKKKEEAMIPYTATGTGGPPKPKPPVLEWKVEKAMDDDGYVVYGEYIVYLMVDGKQHGVRNTYNCRRWFRGVNKRIAEAKKQLMSAYEICLKESGRVE